MATTIVIWANGTPTSEAEILLTNKAAEMQSQGKTDNNPLKNHEETQYQVTRTWTTVADAEEWIVYVEQFGPISATIQS